MQRTHRQRLGPSEHFRVRSCWIRNRLSRNSDIYRATRFPAIMTGVKHQDEYYDCHATNNRRRQHLTRECGTANDVGRAS